jgi:hypothetical protein
VCGTFDGEGTFLAPVERLGAGMSANRGDRHHFGRITAFLPARSGFQGAATAMHSPVVLSDLAYMVGFNTMYAFWGQSTMQAFLSSTEAWSFSGWNQ